MGILDVRREAVFKLTGEVELRALVRLVRERIAKLDPLEVTEQPDGVEFDVGPDLLRIDMWYRPFNALRGVSRGRVRIRAEGFKLRVGFDLRLSRGGWVVSFAAVAGMSTLLLLAEGTPVGFLLWGGMLAVGFLVSRVLAAARFGSVLERALEPHAHPEAWTGRGAPVGPG